MSGFGGKADIRASDYPCVYFHLVDRLLTPRPGQMGRLTRRPSRSKPEIGVTALPFPPGRRATLSSRPWPRSSGAFPCARNTALVEVRWLDFG